MENRIDLHTQKTELCRGGCTKEERLTITDGDICRYVKSVQDGMIVRCVGDHSPQKIYIVRRYYEMFLTSQKNNFAGKECYFEICCGPGRCVDRRTCEEFDGTALALLHSKATDNLRAARFYDIESSVVDVLNSRISGLGLQEKAKAEIGDYNDGDRLAENIAASNPYRDGLNLVFIDPTDCSVPFSTIEAIKRKVGRVDFIINVATGTDVKRAIKDAIEIPQSKVRAKYERFLGGPEFFKKPELGMLLEGKRYDDILKLFVDTYKANIERLGLKYFDVCPVEHYYWLAFASAHPFGKNLWKKARGEGGIEYNGQTQFNFDGDLSY